MQKYNKIPAKIQLLSTLFYENDISRKPLLLAAEAVLDFILHICFFPT